MAKMLFKIVMLIYIDIYLVISIYLVTLHSVWYITWLQTLKFYG